MFTRSEFNLFCRALAARHQLQGLEYHAFHEERLWSTYSIAGGLLAPGDTFLSLGAGSAFVEAALVESLRVAGTVVDLAEAVSRDAAYYASVGLDAVAADLSMGSDLSYTLPSTFDLALSCEIVEHLPLPPVRHFASIVPVVCVGGALLVTTPNAGSLRKTLMTLLHRPTLPPADRTFGPVCLANEGVHRREYMPSEIRSALSDSGLEVRAQSYSNYGVVSATDRLCAPIEFVVPPFRNCTNVLAVKPDRVSLLAAVGHLKRQRSA